MGYQLNTKAYELFIQIEVGLREFMIDCIKEDGVYEWTNNFLGKIQIQTISDISKRINEAYKNNINPDLAEQYLIKLYRAKREEGFITTSMYHPFYYLNWTDLESLLRMKNNTVLIDKKIGKLNRETVVEVLRPLSHLRNDVAHSRYITDENYIFIKSSLDKISILIPDFMILVNRQTSEQTLKNTLSKLVNALTLIEKGHLLKIEEIDVINTVLHDSVNSFWLNSENLELVKLIKQLEKHVARYRFYRTRQGGLLEIQYIKTDLLNTSFKIKQMINE